MIDNDDDLQLSLPPATEPATQPQITLDLEPVVQIDELDLAAQRRQPPRRLEPWDIGGCIEVNTPAGRRLLSRAINEPCRGLKGLGLYRPGDFADVEIDSWLRIWKSDIERPGTGEIVSGWAYTLYRHGDPVLGWSSDLADRQWDRLMSILPSYGPWPEGLRIRITAQAAQIAGGLWYSFSLA